MSNIRYLNQPSNPFWDWIATLDPTSSAHAFAAAYNPEAREESRGPAQEGPQDDSFQPPPPGEAPPPNYAGPESHDHPFGPGFPFGGHRRGGSPHHHGPHHHGGPHNHHRGGWGGHRGRGSRWGGRNMGMGMNGPFDMSKLSDFISQFVPEDVLSGATRDTNTKDPNNNTSPSKDFTPPADIFDTEDAYIIHISLSGAKKEDVGVNWDADKSELNIAGVIYRPGDEEFLKTLALDERKVGVFERKIRLGSKLNPAQVDAEGISAKMEEGVLMVTIPKLDNDIVEVKKVDIE
ncbi:hypothetical protein JMJ35_009044 [Cladonia borealis]|uniref:SHSP domain-containing protein n=1 Tax=Cladonia borealis TaxID=184061 RepID=A0AA39UYG3_9LECA|nr:hypothetical protein JMJ35_009044 [Cladonia borealis]